MSPITLFTVCASALLIQTASSQIIANGINTLNNMNNLNNLNNLNNANFINTGIGSIGNGPGGYVIGSSAINNVPDVAAVANLPVSGAFGAVGTGEIAAAGEVTANGQTLVTGSVPVVGSVSFSGQIPASGVVSIAGNCGCGQVTL